MAQEIFISLVITSGLLAGLHHCFWAGLAWAKMECLMCLAILFFS
jgi:nitric oxide reductase large subunit